MTTLRNESWRVEPAPMGQVSIVVGCEHVDGDQITVRHRVYPDLLGPEDVARLVDEIRECLFITVRRVAALLEAA